MRNKMDKNTLIKKIFVLFLILSLSINVFYFYYTTRLVKEVKNNNHANTLKVIEYIDNYFKLLTEFIEAENDFDKISEKKNERIRSKYRLIVKTSNNIILADESFLVSEDKMSIEMYTSLKDLKDLIVLMQATAPFYLADTGRIKNLDNKTESFLFSFCERIDKLSSSVNLRKPEMSPQDKEKVTNKLEDITDNFWKWRQEWLKERNEYYGK